MHTVTLRKIGGSVGFSLPAPLVKQLALKPGEQVEVIAHAGELVVKPYTPPAGGEYASGY